MKEIKVAEHSGFCFGVKRAIEKTEEQLSKEGKALICGSLIHNKTVTADIVSRGGRIIHSLDEAGRGDTVIVRSHGEGEQFYKDADARGIKLIDATCPFVERIHKLVRKADEAGKKIVIIGDRDHAEVKGISGWCSSAIIVNSGEEASEVTEDDLFVVCQTTIKKELLGAVCTAFEKNNKNFVVENTICDATSKRQESTSRLAETSDIVLIIGDRSSSNTQKLFSIAKNKSKNVFFVEKIQDLPLQELEKCNRIGVAAGASTPESLIKEVIATMNEKNTMSMEELLKEENYDLDGAHQLPNNR